VFLQENVLYRLCCNGARDPPACALLRPEHEANFHKIMHSSALKDHLPNSRLALIVICCIGIALLICLTPYDYQWTIYFSTHKAARFADFMNRSVFDGAALPGAGDLVYPPLLITLTFYILSWSWKYEYRLPGSGFPAFLASFRPLFGFVLMSAFSCALLFVHTTKQVVGRARPDSVFQGKMPFTEWYQAGPHFFTQGSYSGSFPSGHTATASIFIIFAYVLLASLEGKRRWAGGMALAFSILFTAAMGIARMMSASHWLTDTIFTLFSEWTLIHIIFYQVLGIPEQREYFRLYKRLQPHRPLFELRLCLFLLLTCLGVWAFFTGLRSYRFEGWSWLLALTPAGLIWTLFFLRRARSAVISSPPQPDGDNR
jgi:membrane-associated phospholipid phosphatase